MHVTISLPASSTSFNPPPSLNLLDYCASLQNLKLTNSLHASSLKSGLLNCNLFVTNSLLNFYSKCGHLNYAQELFDRMPQRDIVSWTTLISAYTRNSSPHSALSLFLDLLLHENSLNPNEFTIGSVLKACALVGDGKLGQALHGYLITNGFFGDDVFLSNCLIDMYSKMGLILSSEKLLGGLSKRDVVSWSAVISGCVLHEMFEKALALFVMMLEDGVAPNLVTLLSIIRACSLMNEVRNFGCVYAWVMKLGLADDHLVLDSLMEMYCKNGLVNEGLKLMVRSCSLNGIGFLNSDMMAVILHGCTISRSFNLGKELHGILVKYGLFPCTIVENSLIDIYAKSEQVTSANSIFKRMEIRDIVSWNTMISCFVRNGFVFEALELFTELHGKSGNELSPDLFSILSSIQACSETASLQLGRILHGYSIRKGFNQDIFISNSLIDMYAKLGTIALSIQVFKEMDYKDLGSYNSMIQAYAIHGDGNSALGIFTELEKLENPKPNEITFVSVISACSHSGLIKEGFEFFNSMQREYGLEPTMEHYAAIVNLLGRAGKLKEAEKFIEEMPIESTSAVWGSLMGVCSINGNLEVAERAAKKLAVLDPDGTVWRVALSNVYALNGRWEEVGRVRGEMKRERKRKEAGWSSVEVNEKGRSFKFVCGG